jgi:hypothetical protein
VECLGASAKLQTVHMEKLAAVTGRIFFKFGIAVFFENLSIKIEVSLKTDMNNAYFT